MKPLPLVLSLSALALVASMVLYLPVKYNLRGVKAVEFSARNRTDPGARTQVITDLGELRELEQLLQNPVWRPVGDYPSFEGWDEFYSLRFMRQGREERIQFTDKEWSPGGPPPPALLAWARKTSSHSSELASPSAGPSAAVEPRRP